MIQDNHETFALSVCVYMADSAGIKRTMEDGVIDKGVDFIG